MDFEQGDTVTKNIFEFVKSIPNMLPAKKKIPTFVRACEETEILTDIHGNAKKVYPNCFEGAKLVAIREMAGKVRTVQQYRYGGGDGSYTSFSQFLYNELRPMAYKQGCNTVLDNIGTASVSYQDYVDENLILKFNAQIRQLKTAFFDVALDHSGPNSTGSIGVTVHDLDKNKMKIFSQYLQNINSKLSIGTELVLNPASAPFEAISISGKYCEFNSCVSATVSTRGYQLCLYKQIAPHMRVAAILDKEFYLGKSTVSVAYQYDMKDGGTFKAFIDSNRYTGFTLEKSVHVDSWNNEMPILNLVGSCVVNNEQSVIIGLGLYAYL